MQKAMALFGIMIMLAQSLFAQKKERERLKECARVLQEILNVPDDIPKDLIEKANA